MASDPKTEPQVQPPIISEYGDAGFTIGGEFIAGSVMISGADGIGFTITPWAIDDPEQITAENLSQLYDMKDRPNLIVLGIGKEMNHPFSKLRAALSKQAMAVEILTTPAACRTWNLLLSEGRKVAFAAIAITDQ